MYRGLVWGTFSWLTFSGTLHFLVDVVSQYVRGVREPSPATTLYWGLHSSFSLGQVAVGALGLVLASQSPALLRAWPVQAIVVVAAVLWLAIALFFIEYTPPKVNAGVTLALVLAMVVSSRLTTP